MRYSLKRRVLGLSPGHQLYGVDASSRRVPNEMKHVSWISMLVTIHLCLKWVSAFINMLTWYFFWKRFIKTGMDSNVKRNVFIQSTVLGIIVDKYVLGIVLFFTLCSYHSSSKFDKFLYFNRCILSSPVIFNFVLPLITNCFNN